MIRIERMGMPMMYMCRMCMRCDTVISMSAQANG